MQLILEPTHIHLWLVFHNDIDEAGLLQRYRALLCASERQQTDRFYFSKDRHRYLITRAAVRLVLSKYADIKPEDWRFTASSHGRPQIANALDRAGALSFNISHTAGLIVIGVTQQSALGVDVECLSARAAPLAIAQSYFALEEREALHSLPAYKRSQAFFRYWTLKEAYIKARGLGLSIPLNQFGFDLPSEDLSCQRLQFWVAPSLADDRARWRFWQLRAAHDFVIAVCASRVPTGPQALLINKYIPLIDERPYVCEWMAASN